MAGLNPLRRYDPMIFTKQKTGIKSYPLFFPTFVPVWKIIADISAISIYVQYWHFRRDGLMKVKNIMRNASILFTRYIITSNVKFPLCISA